MMYVIDVILMSILIKKSLFCFKKFNENDQIASIFKKSGLI